MTFPHALMVANWAHQVRESQGNTREFAVHRDKAIRAMRAEGASLRQIASAAKLNHSAIAKILKEG